MHRAEPYIYRTDDGDATLTSSRLEVLLKEHKDFLKTFLSPLGNLKINMQDIAVHLLKSCERICFNVFRSLNLNLTTEIMTNEANTLAADNT